jgi:hypothetical protein
MLYATKRELLEGLIVAELIAKPGEGPLARRHFPTGGRGPASGVRSIAARRNAAAVGAQTGRPSRSMAERGDDNNPSAVPGARPTSDDEEPQ